MGIAPKSDPSNAGTKHLTDIHTGATIGAKLMGN